MKIKELSKLAEQEFKNLKKYQKGKFKPVITGREWLDDVFGGLLPNDIVSIAGSSGCVDSKTEFFNGYGWKSIAGYNKSDKVLQYNSDGTAELVIPLDYIKKPSTGFYLISSKYGVNQCVSEEHNLAYETDKGNINLKKASDFIDMHNKSKNGFSGRFRTTFKLKNKYKSIHIDNDYLRLCIAIQADGHYPDPSYFSNEGLTRIRFNLKKERKKERLELLLNNCKIPFIKKDVSHRESAVGFHEYMFKFNIYIKEFPKEWYMLDEENIKTIFDECMYWDSSNQPGNRLFNYYSNSKNNADFIQFVITLSGFRSSIREDNHRENTNYIVGCTKRTLCSIGGNSKKNIHLIEPLENEYKYCFTVPSGMLVLRRNNNINITGNSGKTFELQRVKNNIMNININSNANNFVWLDNSLEMKLISNIIRDLNINLNKSKKKILLEEFTDEEKKLVADYYNNLIDGRFYINEEADDATSFEKGCREFLDTHKDKEGVFISIDHIALQKGNNDGKKNAIDDIIEAINRIKKDYHNVYFIILSQLNRAILGRIKEKDIISMPNRSDLYQSDTIFHISDYVYVAHNPQRLGINLFSRVNKDVYSYLEEHFGEVSGNKASFKTFSKVFFIILKSREASVMFKDIFIENIEFEGKENFKALENDNEDFTDTDGIPIFKEKDIDQNYNPNTPGLISAKGDEFDFSPTQHNLDAPF